MSYQHFSIAERETLQNGLCAKRSFRSNPMFCMKHAIWPPVSFVRLGSSTEVRLATLTH